MILRTLALACAVLTLTGAVARAELTLEEPRRNWGWYGVLFLGLTAASASAASDDYAKSEAAFKKAKSNYALYQAATTSADATLYRDLVNKWHRQAKTYEARGNLEAGLAVVLALTTVASFMPTREPGPILLSYNSVGFRYTF